MSGPDPVAPHVQRVGWTRGSGHLPLADALGATTVAVRGDLADACVEHRLDLLVSKVRSSFDLVPTATPRDFEPDTVERVVVAVADGPNSPTAATVAATLSERLGIPGTITTVYRSDDELGEATARLASYADTHPALVGEPIEAPTVKALLDTLDPGAVLVIGAPEGSWFQRQLMGTGPSLRGGAPGASIVVRGAPRRCFHLMDDPEGRAIGPTMSVADARLVTTASSVPVASDGKLVGIVRRHELEAAAGDMPIAEIMGDPVAVRFDEPADAVGAAALLLEEAAVPVIGSHDRLLGLIDPRRLATEGGV